MGTNYYLRKNCCDKCGRPSEEIHIGKSSHGWCFALHVNDEIKTLDDWVSLFSAKDNKIFDEYNREISPDDMKSIILDRGNPPWRGQLFYASYEDFLDKNHAEAGPNNLARYKIDGHCIGHGDGTYDIIKGEFS